MAKTSWIKCYRSLMDSEIWADEWLVKLWLWCLFKANHKPQTFKGVAIARGQFVTGRHTAADELGVSPSKWYRGIERLVGLGCIETAANKHWTTVTVCNYATYQDRDTDERTTDEQQTDNKRTTDEQPADTRERMTEGNNDRSNKRFDPKSIQIPAGLDTPAFKAAWSDWCEARKENGKPLKPKAVEEQLKRCAEWGEAKAIDSIRASIANQWTGLFAAKTTQAAPKTEERKFPRIPTMDELKDYKG